MSESPKPLAQLQAAIAAAAVLGLVLYMYSQVRQAGFVWDDKYCFHDSAWLRHGDDWTQFIFRNYCEWNNYFRPFVVALFTLELRAFDVAPGPMHLVSLAMHAGNTLLVGLLGSSLATSGRGSARAAWLAVLAMLLYGIHPALIEPVVWIGCQFDLAATFFTLLALLANSGIRSGLRRALAVSISFFLAACSKESAAVVPLLLLILDIASSSRQESGTGWRVRLQAIWRRQWVVYVAVVAMGIIYLALRRWALGYLLLPVGRESFFTVGHFQEICSVYLSYLRIIIWPMTGLGPMHPRAGNDFELLSAQSVASDAAALAILVAGISLLLRGRILGTCIACATAALLPVLHVVPVAFNESLYHERYAMIAIAVTMSLVPSTFARPGIVGSTRSLPRYLVPAIAMVWAAAALINIRITVPLWSQDVSLWQWAVRQNPASVDARDHLLTAYMDHDDHRQARALATEFVAGDASCPTCYLNAANVGLSEGDAALATAALKKLDNARIFLYDKTFLRDYILAKSKLLLLQGDVAGAEGAVREVIRMEPLDARAHLLLAEVLHRQGNDDAAQAALNTALSLFAPDEREERLREFQSEGSRAIPQR